MKRMLCALLLCGALGCAMSAHSLTLTVREVRTEKCRVTIATNLDDVAADDVQVIVGALICLPDEMLRMPGIRFEFTTDQKHLGITWNKMTAAGHHTVFPYDHICVRPNLRIQTVWHEMAHMYHAHLNRQRSNFSTEWATVAGDVYTDVAGTSAGNGVVTQYGRGNMLEDIAEWVEEVYSQTRLYYGPFSRLGDLHSDPRYRKKLDLLYQYHFINKSDYDMMCELFK